MELVNQQIVELEKAGKTYVIEGYPRTRSQALDLQRRGIIPDHFIILQYDDSKAAAYLRSRLQSKAPGEANAIPTKQLSAEQIDVMVQNAILDYNMYDVG